MVSTELGRIAQMAKQRPNLTFTSLNQYLTVGLLKAAYHKLNRNASPGVDQNSWYSYGNNLEGNLRDLLTRAKSGTYKAPPVRRVYIPKPNSKDKRPLGIATIDDKVLQGAVKMILEPIYEQDFLASSYGFRPGIGAHDCVRHIRNEVFRVKSGWVVDADIKKYFDRINHRHLRNFLDIRVRDGVIRRLIDKWLKAGVLDKGEMTYPEDGIMQGGVISPLLSNIYLHYVLDEWLKEITSPLKGNYFKGSVRLFRYADDFVIVCKNKMDAEVIMEVLQKRLNRFSLSLHEEKTTLVNFAAHNPKKDTFCFLGFRFYWGRSRRGYRIVKVRTIGQRIINRVVPQFNNLNFLAGTNKY